jgi:hypothetical protein
MTALVLVLTLGLLGALYVWAPSSGRERPNAPPASLDLLGAESRKHEALGALLDIEEERALGKLTPEDFRALRDEYENEALEAIEELDERRVTAEADDDLEREVAAMRARLACPRCGRLQATEGRCLACDDGP